MGLDRVRLDPVDEYKVEAVVGLRVYWTDSYDLYTFRNAAGDVVRVRCGAPNCGAGKLAVVAQHWQCDVSAAVGLRCSDILEGDVTAREQLRTELGCAVVCPARWTADIRRSVEDRASLRYGLSRKVSGLAAFFDADLFGFGALDLAAGGEALVAQHAQRFDFRALACLLAVLEHFDIAWSGHAIFVDRLFLLGHGAPQDEEFSDVLNRCRAEFIGEGLEHGFARGAVVRKYANFDQTMGVQSRVGFFFDGGSEAITANHHYGIKVMCLRTLFFALSGCQLNLGHAGIIG